MNAKKYLFLVYVLVAGCSTEPLVLDDTHPASPTASSGSRPAATALLQADADTTRTQTLLLERKKQAQNADAEPTASPVATPATGHQMPMPTGQ